MPIGRSSTPTLAEMKSSSYSSASNPHLPPVRSLTPVGRGVKHGGESIEPNGTAAVRGRSMNYDVTLLNPEWFGGKYDCVVCEKVLRYPVKFVACGHNCCSSCLLDLFRSVARCPKDQSKLDKNSVAVDQAMQSEIDTLDVICPNHERRCNWNGHYKQLASHVSVCEYTRAPCPKQCGAEFEKCFLEKHLAEDCPKREVVCRFCHESLLSAQEIEHTKNCSKYILVCPNNCKDRSVTRDQLEDHLSNHCLKQKVVCPYADAGCAYEGLRADMDDHQWTAYEDHVIQVRTVMQAAIKAVKEEDAQAAQKAASIDQRVKKAEIRTSGLIKQYESHLIWKIDGLTAKFKEAKAGAGDDMTVSISSPLIAVSRYGYRLRMTAYLYGYQKALGNYMSLYVCLCSTDHDLLLSWPFRHAVELKILDQCPDVPLRRDVCCVIDASKESLELTRKPEEGKDNPSFGTDKFLNLDQLREEDRFVVDDTIFIRIDFIPPQD